MFSFDHLAILSFALLIDAAVGDPDLIWRKIPHPVVWLGALIAFLDRTANRQGRSAPLRRSLGAVSIAITVAVATAAGLAIENLLRALPFGFVGIAIVAAIFLAGRSLYDHVAAVSRAFSAGGLAAARAAVSRIVGRDPDALDEGGVSRAAIESLAENFSDGVVAPALWFALLGLPGLFAYKAINTADSMIGHRSERHRDFGWAAARLDDLVNLPASRLAGLLIALAAPIAGASPSRAFAVMRADAPHHRSPNAGWPEAAMAAAAGVALSGPRSYHGVTGSDPYINAAGRIAAAGDIRVSLNVYLGAWLGVLVLATLLSGLFFIRS